MRLLFDAREGDAGHSGKIRVGEPGQSRGRDLLKLPPGMARGHR
jgi:hypothetical protein